MNLNKTDGLSTTWIRLLSLIPFISTYDLIKWFAKSEKGRNQTVSSKYIVAQPIRLETSCKVRNELRKIHVILFERVETLECPDIISWWEVSRDKEIWLKFVNYCLWILKCISNQLKSDLKFYIKLLQVLCLISLSTTRRLFDRVHGIVLSHFVK